MTAAGLLLAKAGHVAAAAISAALVAAVAVRKRRVGPNVAAYICALAFCAIASICALTLGPSHTLTRAAVAPSYLAWLWLLFVLFRQDGRLDQLRGSRPVFAVLAGIEILRSVVGIGLPLIVAVPEALAATNQLAAVLQALFVIGALVLVHNLYVGASGAARQVLRAPALALALVWGFDLHALTLGYVTGEAAPAVLDYRGIASAIAALLIGIACFGRSALRTVRPSRAVTFQSFSLLLIGTYVVGMIAIARGISLLGGSFNGAMQVGFVALMAAIGGLSFTSTRIGGWFRVMLSKHLFQHRYDYRAEWMRFNRTVSGGGNSEFSLHERAVQAVADITESPAGVLLVPDEDRGLRLSARWRWASLDVPGEALSEQLAQRFEASQYILTLEPGRENPKASIRIDELPAWLRDSERVWLMVPLVHFERLVGVVVLARPIYVRQVDWEDFDLLRIVGQQLASYLAEQSGQEALNEASRFDEFNRRIAFVMHDIKNLASQMSLLARNAEKHSENPAFRADMLVTLRNSADKLNTLLARLDRYGASAQNTMQRVDLKPFVEGIVRNLANSHPVAVAQARACSVMADPVALEQALVHLIQNAIDASGEGTPVFVNVVDDPLQARIEVIDTGTGMDVDFVRTRLFKPFHSTKQGGFGIGAFEARETIRAMGGRLEVESREGLGTRFTVRMPLATTEGFRGAADNNHEKVA